jgi:DNA topoisomerase I
VEKKPDVTLDENCPVCGKSLALKYGRYGEYTACSDYPKCKYLKLKTTGVACGKSCGGEIVERKSKRGKTFYGCSRYPECDFVLWNKPIPQACPQCGAPFTTLKTTKRSGTVRLCANEECDFKESVEAPVVQ